MQGSLPNQDIKFRHSNEVGLSMWEVNHPTLLIRRVVAVLSIKTLRAIILLIASLAQPLNTADCCHHDNCYQIYSL